MEGNYPPSFYCTERDQQERQQPSQQQQHVAPFPIDIPYHTTTQHLSEFAVDQPHRAFSVPHPGPSILSSIYHDSSHVLSNSSIVQQAHQQLPANVRGHGVKSSTLSANYAPPITTHEPLVESNTSQEKTTVEPAPSRQTRNKGQGEGHQTSSHQPRANSPLPNVSATEPGLLAALNLKKSRMLSSSPDLPLGLSFKRTSQDKVEGVVAKETIEKGVEFGPYTGNLLSEDEGFSMDKTWEVCISGRVFFYIDGRKTWMSQMRCAQSEEEQNMEAFQHYGEIYFRCTKVIEPGSELRVFYSEEYQKRVGIHTKLNDLKFNHDAQKFQCSLCEDLFSSAKLTLRHVRCEHSHDRQNEGYPVLIWKTRKKKKTDIDISSQQDSMKENKAINKEKPVFKCGTCEKVFPSRGRLKEHEMFHDFSVDLTCPVCDKKQKNARTLAEHVKTHDPAQLKCNECNRSYKSQSTFRKHMNEVHGHHCRVCLERFPYKSDCKKHEQTHQAFMSSHSAAKTKANAVKTSVAVPAPNEPKDMLGKTLNYYQRPFKCRFCPKRYSLRSGARTHEREVHSEDPAFKCTHCSKFFASHCRLIDHLRSHEENRMYRCTLCPRSFGSESALSNHQGEHTGLKPFKCDICGKGFRVKKAVYEHKRRIHQKRPNRFFCSVCSKGFYDKGNFIKHERRHKGIRPFVCLECGKGFTAKTCLTTHIKAMHTPEKQFTCELCGKSFSLNQNYTYHMFKHKEQGDLSSTQQ